MNKKRKNTASCSKKILKKSNPSLSIRAVKNKLERTRKKKKKSVNLPISMKVRKLKKTIKRKKLLKKMIVKEKANKKLMKIKSAKTKKMKKIKINNLLYRTNQKRKTLLNQLFNR